MKIFDLWKWIKTKIENFPPSGKFIINGAKYGVSTGYFLSAIYTLLGGGLYILGFILIAILNCHEPFLKTLAIITFGVCFLWGGFFYMFVLPASLIGTICGTITALVLFFFHQRIELTALRAIILTTAFWSPLALLRSVLAMPQIQIGTDSFNQWLFLHIPGMIFLLGMGYVGYKLWKDSESLEETAGATSEMEV